MASLGKISNSLVRAVNENTLALANLNFDFSLLKLEAPAEYKGVGNALTTLRRDSAEFGDPHRTARKLGALFESVIPQTPLLIAAYGKRASEIMESPGVNPSGKADKHGPFAAFVGADATSIWAAATSGRVAIAVHLLACILARAFVESAASTSTWVELILERQREIEKEAQQLDRPSLSQIADINAAARPISREEILEWDSSIRAWLQVADDAMRKKHTQLKLIINNISIPVTAGTNLYADVMGAWKHAMLGLERVLSAEPQSATDGAIVLAISAWHLYPNLLVLGSKTSNVTFSDHLVPPGAVLTLGITHAVTASSDKQGAYWSMALSHYRYYGRPVHSVGEFYDRFTADDLNLVAIGSLLGIWKIPLLEQETSLSWFIALGDCVRKAHDLSAQEGWPEDLACAARRFLDASGANKRSLQFLVDFGRRRGRRFLSASGTCSPWFGLRSRSNLSLLCQASSSDAISHYLDSLSKVIGVEFQHVVITETMEHDTAQCIVVTGSQKDPIGRRNFRRPGWSKRPESTTVAEAAQLDEELDQALLKEDDGGAHSTDENALVNFTEEKAKGLGFMKIVTIREYTIWVTESSGKPILGSNSELLERTQDNLVEKNEQMDIAEAIRVLDERLVKPGMLLTYLLWSGPTSRHPLGGKTRCPEILQAILTDRWISQEAINSLKLLHKVNDLYRELDGATISSRVVEEGIHDAKWVKNRQFILDLSHITSPLTISEAISCIAFMETGQVDMGGQDLKGVIALSSGNSLYVVSSLLSDPFRPTQPWKLVRIIGNIGRPGISLLTLPGAKPLRRELSSSYRAVTYEQFDGKIEDNFRGTSMHLSLAHKFPLNFGRIGMIDHPIHIVQAIISVHDAGGWVADVDIFDICYIFSPSLYIQAKRKCRHLEDEQRAALRNFTSIDTWEEILDTLPPTTVGLVRAHGNWPARLAAFVVLLELMARDGEEYYAMWKKRGESDSEGPMRYLYHEGGAMTRDVYGVYRHCLPTVAVLENSDDPCLACVYEELKTSGALDALAKDQAVYVVV